MKKDDIFEKISPNEALKILRQIAKTDKNLKKKIIEVAEDLFRDVDVDDICETVFNVLDGIDVHELWDRAGPKTEGYTSPEDMSVEMFEEALEPFVQEMQRLINLKMHQEAKLYCMGILKGIHQYEEDSESEFKDWASDVPGESFGYILREWGKNRNNKDKKEMKDFIEKEFPAWSKWAINQMWKLNNVIKRDRLLPAAFANTSVFNGQAFFHLIKSQPPAPHDGVQ